MVFARKEPITRRELLRAAAAGTIGLAIRAASGGARPSAKPPNIVFILADDLGYADVSCYGRPDLSTPSIDHIAAQGLRFLQAYANSAVCTATRTALITERYQYRLRQAGSGGLADFDGGSQKTYQRMIEEMDKQIGRVLQALHANGLTENTIVIFTSDNGGERFADTWPFTGKKTELLEGGLRIPAIISWPARIPRGQTIEQVSISMDWVPTLLAAAGALPDPAYPLDGMNLLPMLTQNAPPVSRKLFWRYKANAQRAARDGDYKFLKILDNTFLFNVVEDPLERANLKERHKDVYQRLAQEWYEWNSSMLPEIKESFTASFDGKQLADHFGAKTSDQMPESPVSPDD